MANMSYCRFTNTLEDLKDCAEVLEEVDGFESFIEDLSREEAASLKKLVALCKLIADDYADELGV
jgi:hypothetical protein